MWADALFAIDREWWVTYGDEVNASFEGRKLSTNSIDFRFGVTKIPNIRSYANSGAGAISAAARAGAKRIILLGFDCQKTGGKSHWHGDHPPHLGNAGRIEAWHDSFVKLKNDFKDVEILNATRETALECFDRVTLKAALCLS